jgi:hypothetical protein
MFPSRSLRTALMELLLLPPERPRRDVGRRRRCAVAPDPQQNWTMIGGCVSTLVHALPVLA